MLVGVPKECKKHEYRVGLTPASVREYVSRGHKVIVETNAGAGIGATDSAYQFAGAEIVNEAQEIFRRAEMIVKVKEPQPSELKLLKEGQLLFTYLHLAPDIDQTKGLIESGCTAVAYETVTDASGGLPLLAPMSEVAGRLSVEAAGAALRRPAGTRGLLLGGVPGVQPARVLIIGGGVVGTQAARMAAGLGCDITILDRSVGRLQQLDHLFQGRLRTQFCSLDALEDELTVSDVVIGAVLVAGAAAPKLVKKKMLKMMKRGAVIVDVSIDQGGCFETSKPTTHDSPTYEVDGVIHYCVANMPGAVPLTSSHALNNATLPYGLALADGGINGIARHPALLAGLNVHRGAVTCKPVADSQQVPFQDAVAALAS